MRDEVHDPEHLLREVWEVRRQLWLECGENWDNHVAMIKAAEAKHPERLVTMEDLERMRKEVAPLPPFRTASSEAISTRAKKPKTKVDRSNTSGKESATK